MSSVSVCSHPHALQCHSFISEHDLEAIEVVNTAIAAQNVQKKGDKSLAAICSQEAAVRHGLDISPRASTMMQHKRNTLYRCQQNADLSA